MVSHVIAVCKKLDDEGDSREHGVIFMRIDTAAVQLHLLPHHESEIMACAYQVAGSVERQAKVQSVTGKLPTRTGREDSCCLVFTCTRATDLTRKM